MTLKSEASGTTTGFAVFRDAPAGRSFWPSIQLLRPRWKVNCNTLLRRHSLVVTDTCPSAASIATGEGGRHARRPPRCLYDKKKKKKKSIVTYFATRRFVDNAVANFLEN